MTTTVPATGAEIVTVTPDMAKAWLKKNDHNRTVRPRAVADYARDMLAGAWLMNGEAIKLATNGTLLDGQHRLMALVEAGVSVPMLVITGLPIAAQETMDSGRKRNTSDALSLRGEINSAALAAILRRVWQWEQGDHRLNGRATPTVAECTALLKERPELRRSAEIAARVHQQFRYMPQSVTGTAHHILTRVSPDEAPWFFARLGDGAELPAGHPILTLRNRIISDRADSRYIADYRLMAYLIRTWNAVRDGRELARIQQPADAPMPMPK